MKERIRDAILKKRDLQTQKEIEEKSKRIKEVLFSLEDFIKARNILFYYSFRSEVKTDIMIKEVLEKKRIFLPKVEGKELKIYEIKGMNEVERGFCGIFEPLPYKLVHFKEIEMVIVPGVAFDRMGFRIGYGKGFYDRFLHLHSFQKIALAFALQIVDKIPHTKEDIRMDKIITEDFTIEVH